MKKPARVARIRAGSSCWSVIATNGPPTAAAVPETPVSIPATNRLRGRGSKAGAYADVNGINLYYEVHGSGPVILLSHGYSATSQMWRGQIETLTRNHRLVLWDMRGHGRSDSPEDPDAYSEALTVDDLTSSEGIARYPSGGEPIVTPDGERVVDVTRHPGHARRAVRDLIRKEFGIDLAAELIIAVGMGVGNAAVFKMVPKYVPTAVGGASGLVGGLGALGGFVIPPFLGATVDAMGPRGYAGGFFAYVVLAVISIGIALYFTRLDRAAPSRMSGATPGATP